MKIVVTGASGYIGNILIKNLLEADFKVTAIDNFKYDNRNIYHLAKFENLNIIEGDVRDESIIKNILSHDLIIPLAALVGAPLCEKFPNDAVTINQTSIETLANSKMSKASIEGDQFSLMQTGSPLFSEFSLTHSLRMKSTNNTFQLSLT